MAEDISPEPGTSKDVTIRLCDSGTTHDPTPDLLPTDIRHRQRTVSEPEGSLEVTNTLDNEYIVVTPENAIEAQRMVNNYKFGFKKWKSHVTSRPLSERSEIVRGLYGDVCDLKPVQVSTVRPTNIVYLILVGWWLSLVYLLVAFLMLVTVVGRSYVPFCWKMAKYFFWPFGKFIYLVHPEPCSMKLESAHYTSSSNSIFTEETGLLRSDSNADEPLPPRKSCCDKVFWTSPRSYLWLLFGAPLLLTVHIIISFLTWLFVITIPLSKVNMKTIMKILWLPPDLVDVGDLGSYNMDPKRMRSEMIVYTHQSVNVYYYKYTVDGMNVILANLLVFVILSLLLDYSDPHNHMTSGVTKCVLAVVAIVPLTYYIGMAIISISAQSSFAIGAVLNATFGSLVELILYVIVLVKGHSESSLCYVELVRSALTGTLVGSILFIPGICMIVGGLKYKSQRFNPKSASVSALLMFVAVGGVFAPTLFSKIYGDLQCGKCEYNITDDTNTTVGLQCSGCIKSVAGLDHNNSLYNDHIKPLVYAIAILLPLAYVVGVVFTLKTHTSYVYSDFYEEQSRENGSAEHQGAAQWSRIKSVLILLASAVLIALCADTITNNIQDLMAASGISEYFIGVTMIAMIPELPEVINGVQFALQNNVNLGMEIGTNTAIQVCLIQVPFLVLINLIHPMSFVLLFNDIHLCATVFSVIVINYIFQDGKSDYFQGCALVAIYLIILCMYFFVPNTPATANC